MKNTQFNVEDVFGDNISKDSISKEKITKLNNFLAKKVKINFSTKITLFKPKTDKNVDQSPSAPPAYE